jgi:RNA polymerase sigma-70 factor (ECF subfamily)
MLVGAGGFTYEEAAEIANCAVGTMKSRVARARAELNRLLDAEPDPQALAKRNAVARARRRPATSSLPATAKHRIG